MTRLSTIIVVGLYAACISAMAEAQVSLANRNSEIVARSSGATGVFSVQEDGSIRHLQSGLVCPEDFPNVRFTDVQIYPSSSIGEDVGCDYARIAPNGFAVSKLTIFAVKAADPATPDDVFTRYRREIETAHPEATSTAPALQIKSDSTGQTATDYRSVGYAITVSGKVVHSELIVGVFNGWVIEVRATYPSTIIRVEKDTTKADMRDQLYDIQSPYLAFLAASDSLKAAKH